MDKLHKFAVMFGTIAIGLMIGFMLPALAEPTLPPGARPVTAPKAVIPLCVLHQYVNGKIKPIVVNAMHILYATNYGDSSSALIRLQNGMEFQVMESAEDLPDICSGVIRVEYGTPVIKTPAQQDRQMMVDPAPAPDDETPPVDEPTQVVPLNKAA